MRMMGTILAMLTGVASAASPKLDLWVVTHNSRTNAVRAAWADPLTQGVKSHDTQGSFAMAAMRNFKHHPQANVGFITTGAAYLNFPNMAGLLTQWEGFAHEGTVYSPSYAPLVPVAGVAAIGPLFGDRCGYFQSFAWSSCVVGGRPPKTCSYNGFVGLVRDALAAPNPYAHVDVSLGGFLIDGSEALAPLYPNLPAPPADCISNALAGMAAAGVPIYFYGPQFQPGANIASVGAWVSAMDAVIGGKAKWMVDYTPSDPTRRMLMANLVGESDVLDVLTVAVDGTLEVSKLYGEPGIGLGEMAAVVAAYHGPELVIRTGADALLVAQSLTGLPVN